MAIPRLGMFAGPNGSGKSTLKTVLPSNLLGIYLNADEIEASIRSQGRITFKELGVTPSRPESESFLIGRRSFRAAQQHSLKLSIQRMESIFLLSK